eukprot:scaffold1620_cov233-Pinguiococcus_pyrenoidosus.AAC.6
MHLVNAPSFCVLLEQGPWRFARILTASSWRLSGLGRLSTPKQNVSILLARPSTGPSLRSTCAARAAQRPLSSASPPTGAELGSRGLTGLLVLPVAALHQQSALLPAFLFGKGLFLLGPALPVSLRADLRLQAPEPLLHDLGRVSTAALGKNHLRKARRRYLGLHGEALRLAAVMAPLAR